MTENTRQRVPCERTITAPDLAPKVAYLPLQSPTVHTSESHTLSHEIIVTLLSPPVHTTKNATQAEETSSLHPLALKKTVTQLSLPVIQTAPIPHHIQHTNKDLRHHTYTQLAHIP